MADVTQALRELGYHGWKVLGDPRTKSEFEDSFSVLLEDGTESKDPKKWPKDLTWEAVETKMNEITAAEPMKELRRQRNEKLTETDWMTFSDSPTMSDEWKTYRQELRDLPAKSKDVAFDNSPFELKNLTWPKKPE
tara:strand:- start:1994 stop:2401 length:408 start_codon:yes stop_codon:yes gene_type:complete